MPAARLAAHERAAARPTTITGHPPPTTTSFGESPIDDQPHLDIGCHRVTDTRRGLIGYTALRDLYREPGHAIPMVNGARRYARAERQAIEEENVFRRQPAEQNGRPFYRRVSVAGMPVCPDSPARLDTSWQQQIICF